MGGKALKQYNVKRISPEEYHQRVAKLPDILAWPGGKVKYFVPGDITGKRDYGDIDVLYTIPKGFIETSDFNFVDTVSRACFSKGKVKNGICTSVEWNGFQLDLIRIPEDEFEFACNYYAHGTHAALLGRIAAYYSYKLGYDGLSWRIRVGDQKRDILLTRQWDQALRTLGYSTTLDASKDYSVDEVFDHITESPLYCKQIFISTKPDRRVGFQDTFYGYALRTAAVDYVDPKEGWNYLKKEFPDRLLEIRLTQASMQFKVWIRPFKRAWRKVWFTKILPAAYRVRGWM